MTRKLIATVRDWLPKRFQVPAKYWYGRARGGLEEEIDLLPLLISHGDLVIDVGGNRGVYAYLCWRLGANVEVFEPNPVCCDVLSSWASKKSNVTIHAVGLSDHSGEARLHIPIDSAGVEHDASASIENKGFSKSRDQGVKVSTLDSFRFESVDFIKIDVEGHEHSVLLGASNTIASSKPTLLVEIEQRHNKQPITQIFEGILQDGYIGYFLLDGYLEPIDRFDQARHQAMNNFGGFKRQYINNFLFIHADKAEALDIGKLSQ